MKRSCLFLAAFLAAPPAGAGPAEDRDTVAMLLAASVAARAVMSTSIDECTARFAVLVDPALDAKMEWDARNALLEERSRMMANRIAATLIQATKAEGYEQFRKSVLAGTEADKRRQARETVTRSLEANPAERRLPMCRELLEAVQAGKMDFAVTQPVAFRILEGGK